MNDPNTLTVFGIITGILLIIFWGKRNAVWGGFTLGVIIGLLIASFFSFMWQGFEWYVVGKTAILGTLIGFIAELLGIVSDKIKKLARK